MATGRGNQLTKQAGEYIVAAELSRRGFVATTFTGNVPADDIVAVDDQGAGARAGESHLATLLGTALVMTAMSLVACLMPAGRASRVDPVIALRAE